MAHWLKSRYRFSGFRFAGALGILNQNEFLLGRNFFLDGITLRETLPFITEGFCMKGVILMVLAKVKANRPTNHSNHC